MTRKWRETFSIACSERLISLGDCLRIGIIGMGGFAGTHHDALLRLEAVGECRLVCTCDPNMDGFRPRRQDLDFAGRGVRLFADYLEMLDSCRDELDVVIIPTPVPLHAPMHKACVERGLAVYLEKPPTLNWAELEEMLAVEARAGKLTNVGFNFTVDPQRQALKRRLVDGEFGAVQKVGVSALWPRSDRYYARAGWAGRLLTDGRLILDSCLGNAMAHHVYNALFWCGSGTLWEWGGIEEVSAELYRAHEIEGMDTVFLRAGTSRGIELDIAMSHACAGEPSNEEFVACEAASIQYRVLPGSLERIDTSYEIKWRDGRIETGEEEAMNIVDMNLRAYFAYLRGEMDRPLNRLVDSRPFVHLNGLVYLAAKRITTVSADLTKKTTLPESGTFTSINAIAEAVQCFMTAGQFPSEQGLAWAARGGRAVPGELPSLEAVIEEMSKDVYKHSDSEISRR